MHRNRIASAVAATLLMVAAAALVFLAMRGGSKQQAYLDDRCQHGIKTACAAGGRK
jgi:hypothetical protein